MESDYERYAEFGFVEQDLEDSIKLEMLYAELNRLERTMEMHGTPYVFVDDDAVRFSPEVGKERFEGHRGWLQSLVCPKTVEEVKGRDRKETLRTILGRISEKDLHPYVLLILAEIVVISGLESFCPDL